MYAVCNYTIEKKLATLIYLIEKKRATGRKSSAN